MDDPAEKQTVLYEAAERGLEAIEQLPEWSFVYVTAKEVFDDGFRRRLMDPTTATSFERVPDVPSRAVGEAQS